MFQNFYVGILDMSRINFGVISLIPKVMGATDIQQFRPITVINVLQRIFAEFSSGPSCREAYPSGPVGIFAGTKHL